MSSLFPLRDVDPLTMSHNGFLGLIIIGLALSLRRQHNSHARE
jgi:hypothetical protein